MGCEWLAGLVWKGLGYVGFVYEIVEITAAVAECLGSCVWNRMEQVQILL